MVTRINHIILNNESRRPDTRNETKIENALPTIDATNDEHVSMGVSNML